MTFRTRNARFGLARGYFLLIKWICVSKGDVPHDWSVVTWTKRLTWPRFKPTAMPLRWTGAMLIVIVAACYELSSVDVGLMFVRLRCGKGTLDSIRLGAFVSSEEGSYPRSKTTPA